MTKSFVAGLLAAIAGIVPGIALAQEGSVRARTQARVEAQGRGARSADNGSWQRTERPQPQERGAWHRADRPARPVNEAGGGDPATAPRSAPERVRQPDRGGADARWNQPRGEPAQRPDPSRHRDESAGADWSGRGRPDQPRLEHDARPGTDPDNRGQVSDRADRRVGNAGAYRAPDRRAGTRGWAGGRYQRARDERAWYDRSDFEDRRDWNWRSDGARDRVSGGAGGWDRGWRQSSRYDWNGYRASHRSAYRLPRYYAPYGWDGGYRRFSLGARLSSSLFAQGYWIEDPYAYRLPDAYEPYCWIRYYNDALLVDMDTGEVVDTIYDIFW